MDRVELVESAKSRGVECAAAISTMWFSFLWLMIACVINSGSSGSVDYLFIVHDAGESNFALPLVDGLLNYHDKMVKVLALGEPGATIYEGYTTELVTPTSLGLETIVVDGNDGRNQTLTEGDLKKILDALSPVTSAVISGMVYNMEAQLCTAFLEAGAPRVIGTDDSFALWDETSILSTDFIEVREQAINEVFLSANQQVSPSQEANGVQPFVTGSPTLSLWRKTAMEGSPAVTRNLLQRMAHLQPSADNVLVMYAGGYGNASYNRSVETFCTTARDLPHEYLPVFSPHPGYSPALEEAIFARVGCADRVLVVKELSSAQVVAASNASLSQCSTVGGQSLSITVPHAYVDPIEEACVDVFTSANLIPVVVNTAQLSEVLTETFRREDYYIAPSDVLGAGVPLDGTERAMASLLQ